MKNSLLSITGATILSRQEQKNVTGGISLADPSQCGCDCAGRVTGPFYCHTIIACPQVYTCEQEM